MFGPLGTGKNAVGQSGAWYSIFQMSLLLLWPRNGVEES